MSYFKDTREGKSLHICQSSGDMPDYMVEIEIDEFRQILKNYEAHVRRKTQLPLDPVIDATGTVSVANMSKFYFYINHEAKKFDPASEIDSKIQLYIDELTAGTVFPPVNAYYNDVLDRYFCFNGYHRAVAYYNTNKDLPYVDNMPMANIQSVEEHVKGFKEQKELVDLGELSETTLSEEQYKGLLKLRNQWRKP